MQFPFFKFSEPGFFYKCLDFHCPCKKAPESAEKDPRVKARPLYAWLTPRIHYYYKERVPKGAAHHLDLVYVLHLPSDRKPPKKWRKILGVLGEQVKSFLHRELGPGMKIDVRIHPEPVKGTKDLAWYRKNLKPEGSWHDWLPISD